MAKKDSLPAAIMTSDVTIANGATTSDALDLAGCTLTGIVFPASMTGTAMTFSVSHDGTTFRAMKDSTGANISITITSSAHIALLASDFASVRYIKLVSGSAETGAKTITILFRNVR